MSNDEINRLILQLNGILMQPFVFDGLKLCVSYVSRAKHSRHWIIQPHYHPWFEFNYVAKGSVYTTIDDREFLVQGGQSYLITPGSIHSHRHNNTGDDGICLRFSLDIVNTEAERIYNVLASCRQYPFDSGVESFPCADGVCGAKAAFAAWLMRLYDKWNGNSGGLLTVQDNSISAQVKLYLKEYFKDNIHVEDIANALNISYRSLARRFKNETGITISDQLTKMRIDAAKQLLKDSNMPLYDIAAAVGYENEFYFSKMFKKAEGIPPSKYRTN